MEMPQKDQPLPPSAYGFADAATAFDQRHPQWNEVMARLEQAINLAFTRTQVMPDDVSKFVYFYGNLVAEDFIELFLLAVNGCGFGAMKLLRSMYEHAVTLKYLHDHPNELQEFIDFDRVQQYKLLRPIIDTFGKAALSPDTIAETKRDFEEVRDKFMVKSCRSEACDERRVGHAWSKLDFVSMAKKAGAIGSMIVPAYYMPLKHAHSTFQAMTQRIEIQDKQMRFKRGTQPKEADESLMTAHYCLLSALEVQKDRFNVDGLEGALQELMRDWVLVWSPRSPEELAAASNED